MKIGNISTSSSIAYPARQSTTTKFSDYLAESVGTKKQTETSNPYKADLEAIWKKGFLKYTEELREEKMREKILKQRGLTEDDLAVMSPEQRAKVEQIIADEIQKRLAAESELDGKKQERHQRLIIL